MSRAELDNYYFNLLLLEISSRLVDVINNRFIINYFVWLALYSIGFILSETSIGNIIID